MALGPQGHQIPTPFGDATAVLTGSWARDQIASATIKIPGTAPASCCHEVELRLNSVISTNSITGYEILFQVATGQTYGIQVARWNGANGQYVTIADKNTIPRGNNGDTFKVASSGTNPRTIKVYVNGTLYLTACDNGNGSGSSCGGFSYTGPGTAAGPFTNGSPGIGFFDDNGTGADWNTFGLTNFSASSSCPNGANYLNLANPTGSLVTLASLGVTTCNYVAASGADTNDGLTESTPWQFAPHMPNCASNCAASIPLAAGTGIIFKGGDTWHMGSNTGAYTGGTWNFNTGTTFNGTLANPIYLGVDQAWFTGGSWARPILTGDNPACNASTLSGTCISGTVPGGAGVPQIYQTSCLTIPGGNNDIMTMSARKYFIVDNFEMTGICTTSTGAPDGNDNFISYGSASGTLTFENLYMHNASHLQFTVQNGASCAGVVCFNTSAFDGSVLLAGGTGGAIGENILFNALDFSDSDPAAVGFIKHGGYNVAYNVIRYTTQGLPCTLHTFHDNLYEFFFENGHSNVQESQNGCDVSPISAIYNNVYRQLDKSGATGSIGLWPAPPAGATDYIFNNVMYATGNMQYFNMGSSGASYGNETVFNNTFQTDFSQNIYSCGNYLTGIVTSINNHFITDNATYLNNPTCNGRLGTSTPFLFTNNSTANASGYTNAQTYAYSPINGSAPTVGQGTNQQSFCATMLASTDALIQKAGLDCKSDTTYAASYNATSNTISWPARTVVTRPVSNPWSIGAYDLSGIVQAGTPVFSPVAGTYLSSQPVTITSSTTGATICYTNDGSTPTTSAPGICLNGITITNGATVNVNFTQLLSAKATKSGFTDSSINTAQYTIPANQPSHIPTFAGNVILKGSVTLK
jgi:hypothetical protein